jgi:endonuclease III
MLIATLLSQNTNDRNSHRAWRNLRKRFPRWEQALAAPEADIAKVIAVGGMKNQKASRMKNILKRIQSDRRTLSLKFLRYYTNDEAFEYLLSLKGIGNKTVACVLLFSLRREVFPVDTHVHRLCNRLGLVKTKTPDATFEAMQALVPNGKAYSFHMNLIRFGRATCKALRPHCFDCPLYKYCTFSSKGHYRFKRNRVVDDVKRRDFMLLEHVG